MPWITYWFRPEIFFCCFLYPQSPNFSLRLSEFMLMSARFTAALNVVNDDDPTRLWLRKRSSDARVKL